MIRVAAFAVTTRTTIAAFTLVALEDLSYAEAAQIECTTVGTIKSRVSRAREFLKASLNHH